MDTLRISFYNCRSLTRNIQNVRALCDISDICFLQELWLLDSELDCLSSVHDEFYVSGVSPLESFKGIHTVRPYGGVGVLYRRSLASIIQVQHFDDPRLIGITFNTRDSSLLFVNIYLPCDLAENFGEFVDYLGKINSLVVNDYTINVFCCWRLEY
jgi:hypothetical protein